MLNDHPRKQLQIMIVQFGRTVCDNPKRCEALLRDFCPEHKRELNLLIAALKENIPQELLNAPAHISLDLTLKLLSRRLHDNLGIAEHFAQWAVESWALSLNVIQQPIVQPVTPKVQLPSSTPKIHATTTTAPHNKAEWTDPQTGMEFVWIPEGSFMMGSPYNEKGRGSDEKQHRVDIKQGFYLGKYLVTQWQTVMGSNPSYFKGDDKRPVEQVSWLEVQTFIAQLNHLTAQQYRLPTEAEWEYACRAGTTTPFYTGHVITPKQANYNRTIDKTTVVGAYPANPWGLYDMVGNLWEWTASAYSSDYKGSEQCSSNNDTNSLRVVRGGSWSNGPNDLRSAYRTFLTSDNRYFNLGFRLSRM